ncbi:MAG: winged helix-turn-helix domain-containing protein [Myxococcota bacterium]
MLVPLYRSEERIAVVDGQEIQLTEKEGEAFAYLLARIGQVVPRTELEQEIWGMRPGVRSETVPVTLRNLRRKLPDDGVLETVRGVGWRIREPVASVASTLPAFHTPWFPRPTDEAAVQALLAKAPVVTVLGPGGSGKTRLAVEIARRCEQRVVYVSLAGAVDASGVVQALLTGAAANGRDATDLLRVVGVAEWLFVIDEPDVVGSAAREVIGQLAGLRFLVCSRRVLEVEGEAVHSIGPLLGADGVAFLKQRLQVSRWGHAEPSEALVERAVELMDGLPLALELLAAHPDPLHEIVRVLERGDLPLGPESERLEATLASSMVGLSVAEKRVLSSLAECEGALHDQELRDWLGPDAPAHVRALSDRSLVVRDRSGWVLLRTIQAFVRRHDPEARTSAKASFHAFLLRRIREWGARYFAEPQAVVFHLAPLLPDVHGLLEEVGIDVLPELVWLLQQYYETQGPRVGAARMMAICERRLPMHPLTAVMRGTPSVLLESSEPAFGPGTDPYLRVPEQIARSDFARHTLDRAFLEQLVRDVPDDAIALKHRARCLVSLAVEAEDPALALRLLDQTRIDFSHWPVLRAESLRRLSLATRFTDQRASIRYAREAVRVAAECQLGMLEFRCRWVLAGRLSEVDLELGAEAYLEAAEIAGRGGAVREVDALHSAVGLAWFALDRHDEAIPLLEAGLRYPSRIVSGPCEAVLGVILLLRDDPKGLPMVESVDGRSYLVFRRDGSSASESVVAYLHGEVACFRARRAGREREELERQLVERSAALRPDDPVLVHRYHDRLVRRVEAARASGA